MTKDRRLGRGLAALLGTPIDETNVVEGSAVEANENAHTPRMAARPAIETSGAQKPAAPSQLASPAKMKPAGTYSQGVTGAVPLNSIGQESAHQAPQQLAQHNDILPIHQMPTQVGTTSSSGAPNMSSTPRPMHRASASVQNEFETGSTIQALEIDVSLIDANPFQPRRQFNEEEIASLAESIKEHQQLQPVLVRKVGQRYQLISGERRLRATVHAGLSKIRAEVREADDRLVAELAIIENLQRKDLNAIEKALSFRRYLDEHRCTQDELAKRLKIDRSTIANLMRLLELPAPIMEAVQNDKLSAGHARALLPLGDEAQQLAMARQIQMESWNVRQTEHAVTEILANEDGTSREKPSRQKRSSARTVTPQIASLEQELRRSLGTKIEIRQSARGKGKIVVHFNSAEEFERIRDLLVPGGGRVAA